MFAIIGGSGLAELSILTIIRREVVRTPYGEPSCALTFGRINGHEVAFIARHGYGHSLAPHEINYRANIWALNEQGVEGIIGIGSVSSAKETIPPSSLCIPDDIIDYTYARGHTFFEGYAQPVIHTDFSEVYDMGLREHLIEASIRSGVTCTVGGVYACTQGPRLDSRAEVRKLKQDGADVIGMTGMPELALAKELNIPYAHLCHVSNWAAGCSNEMKISFDVAVKEQVIDHVSQVLLSFFKA